MKHFLLLALASLAAWAAAPETANVIPTVTIHGTTYSNVVVRDATPNSVMIQHARGMATFNSDRLTAAEKQELAGGPPVTATLEPEAQKKSDSAGNITNALDLIKGHLPSQLEMPTQEQIQKLLEDGARYRTPAIVGLAVSYLFIGLCFVLICSKAGKPSGLLVWIPILQMYPLFRAANMSPVWFRLLLINLCFGGVVYYLAANGALPASMVPMFAIIVAGLALIPFFGWIIWAFKICTARQKSPALGIFLLLPCTNIFALPYLAFSK